MLLVHEVEMPHLPEKSPVTCHGKSFAFHDTVVLSIRLCELTDRSVLDSSIGKPAAGVKVGLYEFVSSDTAAAPVLIAAG